MNFNHAIRNIILAAFTLFAFTAKAQETNPPDSTGLPGDHFSLEGAIELFKKAKSPEDFEKLLNSEDSNVNNLDLNEDGDIDYIRVIDNMEEDVHAIVLQVPVSTEESQDIAVIEIEKTGKDEAILQIIGDETIYGEQTIVEPFDEKGEGGGKGGPSVNMGTTRIIVNVWIWPCVRFVYAPGYVVWHSPWRWAYYPPWWRPWRPRPWRVFYPRTVIYRPRCRVVHTHRVVHAHRVYTPRRTTSKVVHTRTTTRVAVHGKKGTVVGSKTTTKTVKGGHKGKVTHKKTTTKVGAKGKRGGTAVGKKTTTTKKARGKKGTVTKKRSTAVGAKKGKRGAAAGRKKTTVTKRRKH